MPQSTAFILLSGCFSRAVLIMSTIFPAVSILSLTAGDEFLSKVIGSPSRRMENIAGQDSLGYGLLPVMTERSEIPIAHTSASKVCGVCEAAEFILSGAIYSQV